ncbi:MAG TPA: hypothetical protein VLL52_04755 [Anaerolineae bacterium]|nr:hypothetical protein [Anaerolineae bacterium]
MYHGIEFYNLSQAMVNGIWPLVMAGREAVGDTEAPPALLQVRRGRAEAPAWYMVQAMEFHPEPLSVARLRVRDTYAAPKLVAALLEMLASEGWLRPGREGEYHLTAAGLAQGEKMTRRMARWLEGQAEPLGEDEMGQLEGYFEKVIHLWLDEQVPPGNWCLRYSRRRAPEAEAPRLARLIQYSADFNAYRDDAHMAAWRPYQLEGYVWEAFAFVCGGKAETAHDIYQALLYRGYSEYAFAGALAQLVAKGWLVAEGDVHQVTEDGWAVREDVEIATNHYFYAGWDDLFHEEELTRFSELLVALRDAK